MQKGGQGLTGGKKAVLEIGGKGLGTLGKINNYSRGEAT